MTREDFTVGSGVIVADNRRRFGPLNTYGMSGVIKLLDDESGACVEVYVSHIYKPMFWYNWSCLGLTNQDMNILTATDIEAALGGRIASLPECPITLGMLRSWLVQKAHIAEGHPLVRLVMAMPFFPLLSMYANSSDVEFMQWVNQNDRRPRRPRISLGDVPRRENFIPIRRPKIGG